MLNVTNYYEQLVIDQLWEMAEKAGESISQTFIEDVACLALNALPPCYVRSRIDKGANLSESQYQEMKQTVAAAISQAEQQVRRRPHDERES
jgi:hypothetical protein